ncbi:MAG: YraN family protein [Oscillospiraceae bacterium]|nr:YraN family protein [Oscillospiraceae bacterium]MDE6657709.1 YraN family protein [Oscillospiraceae bacterium]
MTASEIGIMGENAVCEYLQALGYRIIKKNFRIRGGEIDIIAVKADELCFVEVKTRNLNSLATGAEAVNYRKKKLVIKTAHCFCEKYHFDEDDWYFRYDIADVTTKNNKIINIDYLENAFDETDFHENS